MAEILRKVRIRDQESVKLSFTIFEALNSNLISVMRYDKNLVKSFSTLVAEFESVGLSTHAEADTTSGLGGALASIGLSAHAGAATSSGGVGGAPEAEVAPHEDRKWQLFKIERQVKDILPSATGAEDLTMFESYLKLEPKLTMDLVVRQAVNEDEFVSLAPRFVMAASHSIPDFVTLFSAACDASCRL